MLEAGEYAPTGMGMQSPIMVVVQDKPTIKLLSDINAEIMGVNKDPFYGAPTVVVVMADTNRPTWVEDGSLVMGNLMNAAHAIAVSYTHLDVYKRQTLYYALPVKSSIFYAV